MALTIPVPEVQPADSLKKRYLYKLGAGFLSLAAGGVVQAVIPRGLGPATYGDLNFLSNFFLQVTNFFDMGTSVGFYTKLSQRQREPELIGFYYLFVAVASSAVMLATLAIGVSPLAPILWPGQHIRYIVMAALFGCLMWISQVFNKTTDAYGLTVPSEIARVLQKILGIALIVPLVWLSCLTLASYFFCQYILTAFLCGAFLWINARHGRCWLPDFPSGGKLRGYAGEFCEYSHPLLTASVMAFISGIVGRWLLQVFGGSVQQGFYGLSYQVGAICFLCASSMTPLLMREFSIAFGSSNVPEMARLFRKHVPILYSVTAYFSCFVSLEADNVIRLMGGHGYEQAGLVVTLMALYPIHQVYGQLSGSLFYATGRTDIFRNISVTALMAGLVLTYVLLAPRGSGGFHLGALGLAIEMLLVQFFVANVQLYFNARFLNLAFWRYVGHQFASAGALLGLAWTAKAVVSLIPGLGHFWIIGFLLAGVLYTGGVAALLLCWPRLFGLSAEQLRSLLSAAKGYNLT